MNKFDTDVFVKAVLAITAAGSLFGLSAYLLINGMPTELPNKEIIVAFVMAIPFITKEIYSYYFGSSKGQDNASDALANEKTVTKDSNTST